LDQKVYHNKCHPIEMGEAEIARFLSSLATERHVSASTQNQAFNALLFLYRDVSTTDGLQPPTLFAVGLKPN
jgi:Phage integrase, N-terminal SAM-like domain